MKRTSFFYRVVLIFLFLSLASCNLGKAHIETTSELGPDTLARIDDLNAMLDRGVEIGPETRAMIEQLNATIGEGIRFGFTEDVLERVDTILALVEDGLSFEVGLDSQTNATVNSLIDTLDSYPEQWEDTAVEIIETLENSASNVAADMADEVRDLLDDAVVDTQEITAAMGTEFRCNVDFLGDKVDSSVDHFIGRSIVGRLRAIISGEPLEEEVPYPWVCQIVPNQIDLVKVGDEVKYEAAIVKIIGYNYVEANMPMAYIEDPGGEVVDTVTLEPLLSSSYLIQLNMQGIDFSPIPELSKLVFDWPTTGTHYKYSIVFPWEEPPPTEVPQPRLVINAASVDVRMGPGLNYNLMGTAERGANYVVTGSNGDKSWWKIDYDGQEGWVPDAAVTRNGVDAPVVSIPPLPTADFTMNPGSGDAPLQVSFTDKSLNGYTYSWDFGDHTSSSNTSDDKNSSHTYQNAGTYNITLTVWNDYGSDTVAKTITVTEPPPPPPPPSPLPPPPTPGFPSGSIYFRTYRQQGAGPYQHTTNLLTSEWDCGIVSMAAMDGDIREGDAGDIFYAYMDDSGDKWEIRANFRTHNNEENWNIGVMCLRKSLLDVGYQIFRHIQVPATASNHTVKPGELVGVPGPPSWHCGVVGMHARYGDIDQNSTKDILKAYVEWKNNAWNVTADFSTHQTHEDWDVDVLCVYNNPSVFYFPDHPLYDIQDTETRNTGVSSANYACGIWGMAAKKGHIYADGRGVILQAYTYLGGNGNWYVKTNFRTSNHETWDIDLICVSRNSADYEANNWVAGWADHIE